MAGESVSLTCSVTLPDGVTGTPDFQWEGPGGVTLTPTDSTTSGGTVSSDLTLSEISTSQAGQYTCTATLSGSITTSTIITVQSKPGYLLVIHVFSALSPVPVPTPSISVSSTASTAGAPLTMTCDYTLSLSLSVNTAVSWMVNGSVVVTSQDGRISTDGDTLTFSPLTTSDTGSYTCTLSIAAPPTPHGTVQRPMESAVEVITVQSNVHRLFSVCYYSSISSSVPQPGVAVTVNNTGTLYAGTGLTLTCTVTLDSSVDNSEHVRIDWGRMPEERSTVSPVMRVSGNSYTGSLTISPLVDRDDGTYTCTGTITGGTTATNSDDISITVNGEVAFCVAFRVCL